MVKALLINPGLNVGKLDSRESYIFPFGLGYIASFAEKHGHLIRVWDIFAKGLTFNDVLNEINQMNLSVYDIIGITGIVSQYTYIKLLTKALKEKTDATIVVGGPLASYSFDLVLKKTEVEVCVIGEGEETFLEILNKKKFSLVDGIAFKTENGIIRNKNREQLKYIDEYGSPAFHLFDMTFYSTHTALFDVVRPFTRNKRTLPIITSRGCPYNCKFCSKSVQGIRMKSLDFLFKEIEYYIKEYKIEAIHFIDELLLLNKKRFMKFCHRIKKYNLIWDCQGRINLVDEQILRAMKDANGVCIGFGIESCSQKILDAMNKRIKVNDIEKVLSLCTRIRLLVKIQIIYGYPVESWKTLYKTLSIFKKLRLPGRRFTTITPLPGSPLYEEAKLDGFIGDNVSDLITEEKYLELLSNTHGSVSKEIFYNRTEFSDKEFFKVKSYVNNRIFNNFLKTILRHPLYILRNWYVYKHYIRNWIPHLRGGYLKTKIKYFLLIFFR